jgi:Domain of unknown function (DUF4191)
MPPPAGDLDQVRHERRHPIRPPQPPVGDPSDSAPPYAGGMAKQTRAEKKVARKERWGARREKWSQVWQAFQMTRKRDSALVWWMLLAFVGVFAVVFAGLMLLGVFWPLGLVMGLTLGSMLAMIVFGRRAQRAAYAEAEGQPGAAAWVLNSMRGNWRVTPAVAGNTQLDAVHRVLGRPGVILVAEGSENRVRNLLSQEKKRVSRVVGETPIYDVMVGNGDDQVPLRRLQTHVMKLPSNLTAAQVNTLEKRLQALGGTRAAMPHAPMPKGGKGLSGIQRTIRRR